MQAAFSMRSTWHTQRNLTKNKNEKLVSSAPLHETPAISNLEVEWQKELEKSESLTMVIDQAGDMVSAIKK